MRAMPEQTFLAFDYGTKKIGVAIGNTLTGQARPLEILLSVQRDRRFAEIEHLLTSWQPDKVIVGLPLASDGAEQSARLRCRRFANTLRGDRKCVVEGKSVSVGVGIGGRG